MVIKQTAFSYLSLIQSDKVSEFSIAVNSNCPTMTCDPCSAPVATGFANSGQSDQENQT